MFPLRFSFIFLYADAWSSLQVKQRKHIVILCFVCWLGEFILLQGICLCTKGQLALYANVRCLRQLDFFLVGFFPIDPMSLVLFLFLCNYFSCGAQVLHNTWNRIYSLVLVQNFINCNCIKVAKVS